MSAPSKCVFSASGDIITKKKRNRMRGETLREIICFKNWGIIDGDGIERLENSQR
jgi:hypothetical protein